LPTTSVKRPLVFGKGNIADLASRIKRNPTISSVVLGIDVLAGYQQANLEDIFGVPVLDRYSVVLQIFNKHAKSKESKLQVALAEIPYIRSRLREMTDGGKETILGTLGRVSGSGQNYYQLRKKILDYRALQIQKAIHRLSAKRDILRLNRQKLEIPVVSIVGYTNCGKTTLIKNLTKDKRLEPKNHLFATLDVTVHTGHLPTLKQVLYIDTVGFIADIPTHLIQAFVATLREVTFSHLIVHVQDVSHPDAKNQNETVIKTLDQIEVGGNLAETMLTIGNKVDLITDSSSPINADMLISATEGTNIDQLKLEIERRLISNTGRFVKTFRVPSGGTEYQWLLKEASISNMEADAADNNYIVLNALINKMVFGRFLRQFGSEYLVKKQKLKESRIVA